jgi:hypothetical protein
VSAGPETFSSQLRIRLEINCFPSRTGLKAAIGLAISDLQWLASLCAGRMSLAPSASGARLADRGLESGFGNGVPDAAGGQCGRGGARRGQATVEAKSEAREVASPEIARREDDSQGTALSDEPCGEDRRAACTGGTGSNFLLGPPQRMATAKSAWLSRSRPTPPGHRARL